MHHRLAGGSELAGVGLAARRHLPAGRWLGSGPRRVAAGAGAGCRGLPRRRDRYLRSRCRRQTRPVWSARRSVRAPRVAGIGARPSAPDSPRPATNTDAATASKRRGPSEPDSATLLQLCLDPAERTVPDRILQQRPGDRRKGDASRDLQQCPQWLYAVNRAGRRQHDHRLVP